MLQLSSGLQEIDIGKGEDQGFVRWNLKGGGELEEWNWQMKGSGNELMTCAACKDWRMLADMVGQLAIKPVKVERMRDPVTRSVWPWCEQGAIAS
jgi:hypothetical protein